MNSTDLIFLHMNSMKTIFYKDLRILSLNTLNEFLNKSTLNDEYFHFIMHSTGTGKCLPTMKLPCPIVWTPKSSTQFVQKALVFPGNICGSERLPNVKKTLALF